MKKIFVLAAVSLAAAGSWAFYPKATEPGGYMMVISSDIPNYSITTISPTVETVNQVIDSKVYSTVSKKVAANQELHKAEIRKINELKQTGWKIISASNHPNHFLASGDYVYLLEKEGSHLCDAETAALF